MGIRGQDTHTNPFCRGRNDRIDRGKKLWFQQHPCDVCQNTIYLSQRYSWWSLSYLQARGEKHRLCEKQLAKTYWPHPAQEENCTYPKLCSQVRVRPTLQNQMKIKSVFILFFFPQCIVCVCLPLCMGTSVCIHSDLRQTLGILSRPPHQFLIHHLLVTQRPSIQRDWIAREPQGTSCPCIPNARLTDLCRPA